MTKDNDLQNTT